MQRRAPPDRRVTTPYRSPEELPPEAPQPESPLRCSACDVPVADEEGWRCPKCLRKTTVVDTRIAPATKALADDPERGELRALARGSGVTLANAAIWPMNDTCPVCAKDPIGKEVVFFRVAKTASGFGSASASVFFRVKVCDGCRGVLRTHEVLRYVAVLALFAGMFATFGFFAGTLSGVALGIVGAGLVAGGLGGFVARNRRLRKHLDDAQVTTVLAASIPAPRGIFEWENASFHAELPGGREAIDMETAIEVLTRDG